MLPVTQPQDMNQAFEVAFNSGDMDRLLALYEPDAVLAPAPGARARGLAEIRAALQQFVDTGGKLEIVHRYCMQTGDIAMLQAEWTLRYQDVEGEPVELSSRTAEVVRRQADGTWRYIIDHAFAND